MARHISLEELVLSSLQSQESLSSCISALRSHDNFTPLSEQLTAFRGLLIDLQQVPADKDTDFGEIKDLLQRTSKFCITINKDLQEKAGSGSTNWSSLNSLGNNVDSFTSKLKMCISALRIGTTVIAHSTGLLQFTAQDVAELQKIVDKNLAASRDEYESATKKLLSKLEELGQKTETE